MSTRLLTLIATATLALLTTSQLGAQGTVNFSNIGGQVTTSAGTPVPAGGAFNAALYFAPAGVTDESQFIQVGAAASFLAPGTIVGGTRTAPLTPPGATANFQVRAWETAGGATYEDAVAAGTHETGKSAIITVDTGDPTTIPPGTPGSLGSPSFQLNPAGPPPPVDLMVDFTKTGGAVETGWQGYFATHENAATFTTQSFPAFGTTIDITPTWNGDPGADNRTKQMIDRSPTFTPPASAPDLYRDWIGLDSRSTFGAAANPMTITISGLPAALYQFRSHHHDAQNQTGLLDITINDASGSNTTSSFDQSAGGGAGATPATFNSTIESDGSDVTITYLVLDTGTVTNAFAFINGLELFDPFTPDSDGDGLEDLWEDEHFGDNSGTVENSDLTPQNGTGDADSDDATNEQEETNGTDPNNPDSDGDGLTDGAELNTHNSDPLNADSDGDGLNDGVEVNTHGSDPNKTDSDGDHQSDGAEVANNTNPSDDTSFTRVAELAVDFNSNQDDGGNSNTDSNPARGTTNHNQFGYQSYHANHEVIAEFTQATYPAFGTTITLDVDFPDTTDNRVQQSIDRTNQDAAGNVLGSFDANWQGDKINLLTDWIGVDTRIGQGGNGPYDGTTGTPTRMTMDLGGLPAGSYTWRSFHHDTEHMNPEYIMEVSTDGGATFFQIGGIRRATDSTPAGTPPSPFGEFTGAADPDPANLPSTVNACFLSNGIDNVQFRYTPLPTALVHTSFFMMNGFEIDELANDSDDDCFDDDEETAIFGDLSQGPDDDFDGDNLTNLAEIIRGTDPTKKDSDDDGIDDDVEIANGTEPTSSDTDGDGLSDGDEDARGTDPLDEDSDDDGVEDLLEVGYGSDPLAGPSSPLVIDGGTLTTPGTPLTDVQSIASGVDFAVIFSRPDDFAALGLTYLVEFSFDLNTWFPSGDIPVVIANGPGTEAAKVPYPFVLANGRKARFWRLVVGIQ